MPPVFRQGHDQPPCQDPARCHPVRGDAGPSPGRLPSVRSSTLRPSGEPRDPSYVRATLLAPFRPDPSTRPRPRGRAKGPCYPAPPRFASRLASWSLGKMLLTDFCNRLTTRAPVNRSTTEHATFAASTSQVLPFHRCEVRPRFRAPEPRPDERFSCVAPDRLAAIRPRLACA